MNLSEIDLKIKRKIKLLRELMGVKPEAIAISLKMSRSNYHKIENGTRKLSAAQLVVIAKEIKTTGPLLLWLTEEVEMDYKLLSLNELIIKLSLHYKGNKVNFNSAEQDFISKIQEKHAPHHL